MVNKKKISIKQKNNYAKKLPIIIFSICLIMSIGYATINSINLDVSGEMVAYEASGIVIEEVTYVSSNNADTANSKINATANSVLNSTIVLSSTDSSSSITYKITVYNSNDYRYIFKQTSYDSSFYDNENITYELSGLNTNSIINPKSRLTFTITFKYKTGVTPDPLINTLNSFIDFQFNLYETTIGDYAYTGSYQTFVAPETGTYKIELWGASGGRDMLQGILYDNTTGLGGYTSGHITLQKNDILYIYVGGQGGDGILKGNAQGGFNGGGSASHDYDDEASGAGGGATDVRLIAGEWNNETSLKSRIMVAGAGASERVWDSPNGALINYVSPYCAGGGLSGYTMVSTSSPGTQTTGYAFGYGETGTGDSTDDADSGGDSGLNGGGGGYYGGTSGDTEYYDIAAGGSSFISGHNGCVAIISETSLTPRNDSTGSQCTDGTTDITCSFHYSNYIFENTTMIDGAGYQWTTTKGDTIVGMPTIDGTSTMNGNSGNGHAKITLVEILKTPQIIEEYAYTGDYQTFTAPYTGRYKIELWGAKGSDVGTTSYPNISGAPGAYTAGELTLTAGETLYVYVGQKGTSKSNTKTFNNGTGDMGGWNGGGATDVRLVPGEWDTDEGLYSRIMVAAGGGTSSQVNAAGAGGGLIGYSGRTQKGGTQTSFPLPTNPDLGISKFGFANGGCNSGGGYYPGAGAECGTGSPGGSSFISGHNGCVAIESSTSLTPRKDSNGVQCTDGTTDITCSYHYSKYIFKNTLMIDGMGYQWTTTKGDTIVGMPTIDGTSTMNGNSGDGYAKITLIDVAECPNDGRICDLSGNENHLNIVGATWDKTTGEISTDGVDDYLYIDMLEWNETTEFTIEFYAQLIGSKGIFFESSKNSNNNYGSFYINTGEYGTNDLTLAMKFNSSSASIHHRHVDNFIDPNNYHHYVITLNTNDANKKFIKMYKDGVYYETKNPISSNHDISGLKLRDYPFYIGSRNGSSSIQQLKIKNLKIYTKELTLDEVINNYNGINIKKNDLLVSYNFR